MPNAYEHEQRWKVDQSIEEQDRRPHIHLACWTLNPARIAEGEPRGVNP